MRSGLLYIGCLLFTVFALGQDCPNLLNPLPNAMIVPVDTAISWEEISGVTGYIISLGTIAAAGEIVDEQPTGSDTSFIPLVGLPEFTLIHVTITLFFFDQPNIVCPSQSFMTENVITLPGCTQLNLPQNGAIGVDVGTNINWNYAPRAMGYRITLGTAAGLGDIVNNLDVGNTLMFNPTTDFPPSTAIYDRFGKALTSFGPNSVGWDGIYDGKQLPADGYWYKAFSNDNRVFSGHFSLAR